jgi:hypothetical protein
LCQPSHNPFVDVWRLGRDSELHDRASSSGNCPSLTPEEGDFVVPVQHHVDEPLPRRYRSALRRLLRLRPHDLDALREFDPALTPPEIAHCLSAVSCVLVACVRPLLFNDAPHLLLLPALGTR